MLTGSYEEIAVLLANSVKQNDIKQVKLHLLCGADASAADYDRRTPLHVAAAEGNMAIVQVV